MAISQTYKAMQSQIADELSNNTALLAPLAGSGVALSPVQNAIQSAITKWERETFYFNRLILQGVIGGPFNTVQGQEYYTVADYALIPTLAMINKLWTLVSNNRYTLNPRPAGYLDDTSVQPTNRGQPVDYSYDAQMLRFYPIPDNAYPIGLRGTQRQTPLVVDNDTNVWTQDAYDLIRSEAKWVLASEVLNDQEAADAAYKAIYGDPSRPEMRGYLYALKAETTRRMGPVRVRATHF